MAKIHTLKIKNFRSFKEFKQVFGITDFVCIIGRGDSGKSSILEAISYVLSPNWNLSFYDTDFFNGDINSSIEIEVTLYDLPKKLLHESKYGMHIRGLNTLTNEIHDTIEDDHESVLTIKLKVERDLEPKWFIVNDRVHQEDIEIKSYDRASLNVFLVSDYVDRHFSWNKGTPLFALLNENDDSDSSINAEAIIDALREAKTKIDSMPFTHLANALDRVKTSVLDFGVDISGALTTIDIKDILIKDGKICLHDGLIPFRLKGKGSKRLISIAIQMELAKVAGGIILIDEIEQGLEPDRAQHIARHLKLNNKGQIFITTHSRDVLVELKANDLFRIKKNSPQLFQFDDSLQGCIRSNPEAFFSDRVLVCEGLTEIGICRGLNAYRIKNDDKNAALNGVQFANGGGSNQVEYAKKFLKAGYRVCLFCDSDVEEVNSQKEELKKLGVTVIDSEAKNSIENQLFQDLPWAGIKELIDYKINEKGEDSIINSIKSKYGDSFKQLDDTKEMRIAIFKASTSKQNEWFKRIDHGEFIAEICFKHFVEMEGKRLKLEFDSLSKWIDND